MESGGNRFCSPVVRNLTFASFRLLNSALGCYIGQDLYAIQLFSRIREADMPTIQTLGHATLRTEFTYSGSVKEGVTLHFDRADKIVSAEFFKAILNCFKGAT